MVTILDGIEQRETTGFKPGAKSQLAGLMRVGKVTTATSSLIFESTDLIGQDDFAFEGWYVSVLQADNTAPEGELKPMSAYESATGKVTHTAFTQPLTVGDWVVLLRPEIAMLGKVNTTAAVGAVTSDDFMMAYVKQIVTNTETLTGGISAGVAQTFELSVTSAANVGDVTIATITDQPCLIESVVIHADTVQPAHMTSCGVFGGASKVITFIAAADASQADLDAIDKQVYWEGRVRLAATKTIVISLAGTGTDAVDLTITVKYRACVNGGYLA